MYDLKKIAKHTLNFSDRSVRPMFPEGSLYDTQLSCQPLAVDSIYDPDVISINAGILILQYNII